MHVHHMNIMRRRQVSEGLERVIQVQSQDDIVLYSKSYWSLSTVGETVRNRIGIDPVHKRSIVDHSVASMKCVE